MSPNQPTDLYSSDADSNSNMSSPSSIFNMEEEIEQSAPEAAVWSSNTDNIITSPITESTINGTTNNMPQKKVTACGKLTLSPEDLKNEIQNSISLQSTKTSWLLWTLLRLRKLKRSSRLLLPLSSFQPSLRKRRLLTKSQRTWPNPATVLA